MNRIKKTVNLIAMVIVFLLSINISNAFSMVLSDLFENAGGRGYFMFGPTIMNISGLNSEIKAIDNNFTEISNDFMSIGGGGHAISNKLIIGGEGHAILRKIRDFEVNSENYDLSVSGAYGFFNIGHIIYKKKSLNVYPMLGIGGGYISQNIKTKQNLTFQETLTNPNRGIEITKTGFMVNLSISADFIQDFNKAPQYEAGLVYGLRVGYIFDLSPGNWSTADSNLPGSPSSNINGPYIRFSIGGGTSQLTN